MIKIVSRGQTATASAYLTPSIVSYLDGFRAGFDDELMTRASLSFMRSDGGLTSVQHFQGHQAILSGPAGGVVGYAKTSFRPTPSTPTPLPCIGFDLGGTSTDVSRYDGQLPIVFESTTAGVTIQTPQLDINTVAAGGGSRLFLRGGSSGSPAMLVVGPESAGSEPGPVCYRKPGGLLAVTDANAVLGRVIPSRFPRIFGPTEDQPLDLAGARTAFEELMKGVHPDQLNGMSSAEELAYGFLKVANEVRD
jgi:5-oxoprolinase (ATP-hydrolysing)